MVLMASAAGFGQSNCSESAITEMRKNYTKSFHKNRPASELSEMASEIGFCYKGQNDSLKVHWLKTALNLYAKAGSSSGASLSPKERYYKVGKIYFELGDFSRAKVYLTRAKQLKHPKQKEIETIIQSCAEFLEDN